MIRPLPPLPYQCRLDPGLRFLSEATCKVRRASGKKLLAWESSTRGGGNSSTRAPKNAGDYRLMLCGRCQGPLAIEQPEAASGVNSPRTPEAA